MTIKLTDRLLEKTAPPEGEAQVTVRDGEVAGFLCVVGRRKRTFFAEVRVAGDRRKVKIGALGALRADGYPWTAQLARQRARELLGLAADGVDPTLAPATGPTLREGLTLHLSNMQKGGRLGKPASPKSIRTMKDEVLRYLGPEPEERVEARADRAAIAARRAAGKGPLPEWIDWLDRPLAELTSSALRAVHDRILDETKGRAGGNPRNPPGASVANRLRRHVSAIWESLDREAELPFRNPARGVVAVATRERESRIEADDFRAWMAAVLAIENTIRRDLQLLALFTGVRRDGLTRLRWDDVNFERGLLQIEHAKGDKPYTLPLGRTARQILERRLADNATEYAPYGGDHGFVFPSLSRAKVLVGKRRVFVVQPVAEPRESIMVLDPVTKEPRKVRDPALPPVHDLRRTFNSVAMEAGVPPEARERLMNHAGHGVNVKHYGQPRDWGDLAAHLASIEARLWKLIRAKPARKELPPAQPAALAPVPEAKRPKRKRRAPVRRAAGA